MVYLKWGELVVRTTEERDIENIKDMILPEIEREIQDSNGISAYEELKKCFGISYNSITVVDGDTPICISGVIKMDEKYKESICWFFTSTEVHKHKILFYKFTKFIVSFFASDYTLLYNYIDARFERSIEFFKRLGCSIGEPEMWGELKVPFRKCTYARDIRCR